MLDTLFVSEHQFFDNVGKYKLLVFEDPFFQDVCILFTPFRVRRLKVTTHIKLPNLHERYHNNKRSYRTQMQFEISKCKTLQIYKKKVQRTRNYRNTQ